MKIIPVLLLANLALLTSGCRVVVPPPTADALALEQTLLTETGDARRDAAMSASDVGASAVVLLGPLLASDDHDVRKNAGYALWSIAHHASRPGGGRERDRVSLACVQLLQQDPPLATEARAELLAVLSITADDATTIRYIGSLLDDPEVGDVACRALENIDDDPATEVLVEHLPDVRVIRSLGSRGGDVAVAGLIAVAGSDDPALARAARSSLARIGHRKALPVLDNALDEGLPGAADDLLRLADGCVRSGDEEIALNIYDRFVEDGSVPLRAAAAAGLGDIDDPVVLSTLLVLLKDVPQVRGAAEHSLVAQKGLTTNRTLREFYPDCSPAERSALLRILSARQASDLDTLLIEALSDESPEVRVTALSLARTVDGGPVLEERLREIIRNGSEEERDAAYLCILESAKRQALLGRQDDALATVHHVLEQSQSAAVRTAALEQIAAIASPTSLDVLARVEADEQLKNAVASARYRIAGTLIESDRDRAILEYDRVFLDSGSRKLRAQAVARLHGLDVEVSHYPRRAGFLIDWQLLGTFPKATEEDLAVSHFDPIVPAGLVISGEQGELSWTEHRTIDFEGRVDLVKLFEPNVDVTAYALTEFEMDGGEGMLKLGSDDGIAVWLNGVPVHSNFAWRGINTDEDTARVTFRPGINRLLVKITQGGGGWAFCVRVADTDGQPVDLNR